MRYFAIILLFTTAALGVVNDFDTDDNCVAVYYFEDGALILDSKGSNTLTNNGVTADLVDYKEGVASGDFVSADTDYLEIADGDLDSGFPLKSGEANRTFSFTFWFKLNQIGETNYLVHKNVGNNYSLLIWARDTNVLALGLALDNWRLDIYEHASTLSADIWYHVGITHNATDGTYRIRIWDDDAGATLGSDKTGTASNTVNITPSLLRVSYGSPFGLTGNLDEIAVFGDVLTAAEIDAIRGGTYISAESPPRGYDLDGNLDEVVVWNDALTVAEIDSVRNGEYDDSTNYTILDVTTRFSGFTGSDDDFFSFTNWLGVGYFTNNVDQIFTYSGSGTVAPFNIRVDSAGELNHVQTCRYIFVKNDRLLLLDVVEHGNWIPQRCRFSAVLSTDFSIAGGGYVDAPTEHRIVSAGWVGKDIVVFFRGKYSGSLWKLRTTGNTDLPFRWDKISDTLASQAPYAAVEFNDGIAVIGLNNIIFYDGFRVQYLDLANVRDIVDDFDQSKLKYSTALHAVEDQHVYFTYTTLGESYPNRMLDYNVLEQSWSVHKYDVHVLGTFDNQDVPIWTDIDIAYTGIQGDLISSMDFDVRDVLGDPFPFTLMGTRESTIYKLNTGNYDGTNDSDGTIDIDIQSSRWNPFIAQNQQAALGKMLFLVDNDEDASFTVSYYKDMRSTAWTTRDLSCDSADDGADKFWITTNLNGEVANFHRIKISHDERNNRPRIHAIMPFFMPAGELKFE